MPSLLQRLGQGLGQGMQMVGQMGLEEQREKRLAAIREKSAGTARKEEQTFRTGEREAGQEFQKEMATLKGEKPAAADKVKFRDVNEDTGKTIITYESGKREEWDPETDTTRELGKGKGTVSEESKGEDISWGEKMANRQAGLMSGDESDFPFFKDETKAAEAASQFRSNARKAGTLDDFDTEFAKRGWGYIQELAGGDTSTAAKAEVKKAGGALMSIFKDFDKKDYDGIANQIISDPSAPESLKQEARDYLKGAR